MGENLTTNENENVVLTQLERNPIYNIFKEKCLEKKYNKEIALVELAIDECVSRSKMILGHMKQYTLHDEAHLFRVLDLSAKLLGMENIRKMSVPEL